jgi:hypothetical protein
MKLTKRRYVNRPRDKIEILGEKLKNLKAETIQQISRQTAGEIALGFVEKLTVSGHSHPGCGAGGQPA